MCPRERRLRFFFFFFLGGFVFFFLGNKETILIGGGGRLCMCIKVEVTTFFITLNRICKDFCFRDPLPERNSNTQKTQKSFVDGDYSS